MRDVCLGARGKQLLHNTAQPMLARMHQHSAPLVIRHVQGTSSLRRRDEQRHHRLTQGFPLAYFFLRRQGPFARFVLHHVVWQEH